VSPVAPDTTNPDLAVGRLTGTLIDLRTTDSLAWHTYRYDKLLEASDEEVANLESTARGMAFNLGLPFFQLALAFEARGDQERKLANIGRALKLISDSQLRAALQQMSLSEFTSPLDSPPADSLPR
jgi:hypothetical protein